MINAQMKPHDYYLYGTENAYGERTVSYAARVGTIVISINLLQKNSTDNIKFSEATYIGLTLNREVDDNYIIDYNNKKLKVLYVYPEGRYTQVYMKEL